MTFGDVYFIMVHVLPSHAFLNNVAIPKPQIIEIITIPTRDLNISPFSILYIYVKRNISKSKGKSNFQEMVLSTYYIMNYPVIIYGTVMAIIDVITFSLLSKMKINILSKNLIFALFVLYGFQPIIFYHGLTYTNMSILNLSWNLMSNIIVTTVGILYIGNVLTVTQSIGIVIGILSLYLMNV